MPDTRSGVGAHYDAAVIGSGQGGKPLAIELAERGLKTALVERGPVGGTCVNVGCTPTKTMAASARVAYLARRAADYGVSTGAVKIDLTKVRERKRRIVESFRSGSERGIRGTRGLDFLEGSARFTGPKSVEVESKNGGRIRLAAERIFINTGARPSVPSIPGIDDVGALDSTSVMELGELPKHLIVLGGGYVGVEFGQMFRRFGSDVTIVQRASHLLPREDADVSEEIARILRGDGVEVILEASARRLARTSSKGIELALGTADGERSLRGSHLLVAAGRVPNTEDLGLEAAGVRTNDRGFIEVNHRLETNVPGIFAIGDVKGGPAFTHISYDDYRILTANLFEGGDAVTEGRLVPYTVFMDPQLGRVGMTEREARARGRRIKVARLPMSRVARALEMDETRGFMKAVVDSDSGEILGCAILGVEGGEVMAVLQVAMMGGIPYRAIRDGIFAHPTLAESLNNLFLSMQD